MTHRVFSRIAYSTLAAACAFIASSRPAVAQHATQPATQPGGESSELMTVSEAPLLTNARQLIFEGKRSGEGYFSSDGNALVFQSEREANNPFYQIYTLDLITGDSRRVSTGGGKTTCAWFRPGSHTQILFASTHLDPDSAQKQQAEIDFRNSGKSRRYAWDYDEHMDLFLSHEDGSAPTRLTDARGYDAEGSFSPDGKHIAFCSLRDAYPPEHLSEEDRRRLEVDPSYFGEIYIANADGSEPRRLTHTPGYDGGPFFSPDGQRIIWRRFDKSGALADVYTMKLDGSDERRITDFGAMSWAPYFHPSGDYIVFASNKHGFANFEVFLVDAAGEKEPVRVTHTAGFDGLPVFSPDGTKLAWTSGRTADGKSQIFIADWDDKIACQMLAGAPPRVLAAGRGATQPTTASVAATPTTTPAAPAQRAAITPADLREHVAYLASDELEGRLTGTEGAHKAAEYIARDLAAVGVQPGATDGTFFQAFDYTAGVELNAPENRLAIAGDAAPLAVNKDFSPASFSENGEASGNVVFAGYGLSMPGTREDGYDSYAGVDVKGKIALVLRYAPEGVEGARKQELNRYAGLRYKAMIARDHGATALLVVTGPNSPNASELLALGTDRDGACGIPVIGISGDVAARLFASSGKNLKELQDRLDKEDPHADSGFTLPATVDLKSGLTRRRATDRNVIGVLPPESGDGAQYIVIGAHYDHLGHGQVGAMNRAGEEGQICNGADDNASGTSVVLEIARSFVERRKVDPTLRKRGLIFAFWSGEEMGLLGSSAFAAHPTVPIEQIVAYVNFDMVGRLRGNKLAVQGVGSSNVWTRFVERRNVAAGFAVTLQNDPYLPTDSTAFYTHGVPAVNFFTSAHDDYHRPTDDTETLNYEGMQRIATLAGNVVADLVVATEKPDYVKVETTGGGGGREALRVYIGSIPDYATEVVGVKLSGVRGGSPADKAGLKGGDVIVEFAGTPIKNIYDYTYAIEAARIGTPLNVIVERDGQRVTISVTPEARK